MSQPTDLDLFKVYTGVKLGDSRSEVVARALADPRTRDLVWLYLVVNEIPWKRLAVPARLASALRQQGQKASVCPPCGGRRHGTGSAVPFACGTPGAPEARTPRSVDQRSNDGARLFGFGERNC